MAASEKSTASAASSGKWRKKRESGEEISEKRREKRASIAKRRSLAKISGETEKRRESYRESAQ